MGQLNTNTIYFEQFKMSFVSIPLNPYSFGAIMLKKMLNMFFTS